jgi:hypothetical protein
VKVEPSLWVRIYVEGRRVVDEAITMADLASIGERHLGVVQAAEDRGQRWLVEVVDPDAPADQAHLRFGSDTAGMVAPIPVDLDQRSAELQRRGGPGQN